jgi:hypothetical protein
MRGRKGSTFEGGLRSPCLIRYPDRIRAGSEVTPIAAAIDLLPTLADLAGLQLAPRKPLDGQSIAPLLRGEKVDWQDRTIFSAWNNKASVRNQRFRMQATGQLYDLQQDPGEQTDVAREHPQVAQQLSTALHAWIAETKPKSSRSTARRPITLAHPDATFTQLPSRDATAEGGIVRSNRFPNCTFMTEWKDTKGEIHWDVEVLGSGQYEVQMYYACEQDAVGSVIQLSLGDQQISATIDVANDSPLIGAEHDRFERAEGYVRNWRPMTLGRMQLEPGKGTLKLRATKVTGKQVADMRLLMFRRI